MYVSSENLILFNTFSIAYSNILEKYYYSKESTKEGNSIKD